jgi:transposase
MAPDNISRPVQRRYPPELRERAVRLVFETAAEQGERFGAVTRVAGQLGIGPESVRQWVRQAEIDRDQRGGLTIEERDRMEQLERSPRPPTMPYARPQRPREIQSAESPRSPGRFTLREKR